MNCDQTCKMSTGPSLPAWSTRWQAVVLMSQILIVPSLLPERSLLGRSITIAVISDSPCAFVIYEFTWFWEIREFGHFRKIGRTLTPVIVYSSSDSSLFFYFSKRCQISTRANLAVRLTKKKYLFEFLAGVYVPERDGGALTCWGDLVEWDLGGKSKHQSSATSSILDIFENSIKNIAIGQLTFFRDWGFCTLWGFKNASRTRESITQLMQFCYMWGDVW